MTQSITQTDGVEVNGETVVAVLDGMGNFREKGREILANNGILAPEAGRWYKMQSLVDALNQIAGSFRPITLTSIGRRLPDLIRFPVGINDIHQALFSMDITYHLNHRKNGKILYDNSARKVLDGIGHYYYKYTGPSSAVIVCTSPYPCDYDRGLIDATALRFKPFAVGDIHVTHEASDHCRKNGDDFCAFKVEW
ncbi:hypothetical protein hrd7_33430 (plasmid) [Leptolinea sp. HRD-7]|nr:hypothetical protein hrd7_33430 [Leptolinea sp. HRD-7]